MHNTIPTLLEPAAAPAGLLRAALTKALILIMCIGLPVSATRANTFMPPTTYYGSDTYLADAQNWACEHGEDGTIYIANNAGLLCFDSYSWRHTPMPNGGVLRSLLADGDRLYAGSFEEFGYFDHDIYGNLCYHSISDNLDRLSCRNEDIWNIRRWGSKIVFQSFNSMFVYDGQHVTCIRHPSLSPLYAFVDAGNILVQAIDDGLYMVDGDNWNPLLGKDAVPSHIVALEKISSDSYLAFTESHGVLLWHRQKGTVEPWRTDVDSELRRYVINRVVRDAAGTIYIGTVQNGLYALTPDGRLLWNCNSINGLENNSVLGLHVDPLGNVWVMLDDGMVLVHTGAPFTVMAPDSNSPYIGMVYSTLPYRGNLLVASNQGLYLFDHKTGNLQPFKDLRGQTWQATRIDDGSVFVSGNNRSLCIRPDGSADYIPFNATCTRKCTLHGRDVLVQTSYYNMNIYDRDERGRWRYSHTVDGFGAPLRQVEADASGALWCSHLSRGIYRIELDPTLHKIAKAEYFDNIGAGTVRSSVSFVVKIRGKVLIANENGLFEFDDHTRLFEPYTELDHCLPSKTGICSVTPVDDSRFWVATRSDYNLVGYDGSGYHSLMSLPTGILHRKNNGANNSVSVDSSGVCYFTFNNAVGRCDMTQATHSAEMLPAIRTAGATTLNRGGQRLPLPVRGDSVRAVAEGGNINVKFLLPNFNHVPCRFHYVLKCRGKVTETVNDKPEITYADLDAGNYTLTASVVDDRMRPLSACTFNFSVPHSPWLSWWAIAIYFITAITLIWGVSQLYLQIQIRRRRRAFEAEKAEQDLLLHQQELIIAEQQKQLLETELTTKGKELASLAMSAYSKQQVIDSMKESLADQRSRGGSGYQVASALMKKIESADTGSREFWSVFEINFDLIHQHFFRNLRASYPNLSPTDLKFCALLRLNLATKDIARFTNISVRGVETARYRLRKKFNLQAGESLVDFLISFHGDTDAPQNAE